MKTSMHVGTHIDGPRHLLNGAPFVADISINNFIGRGVLLDARGKRVITHDLLHGKNIEKDAIVLVLTGWDKKYNDPAYMTEHPVFDKDCAQALIACNIRLVGIDMPSVDDGSLSIHKIFFEHTIMIIENLTHLDALVDVAKFTVYDIAIS